MALLLCTMILLSYKRSARMMGGEMTCNLCCRMKDGKNQACNQKNAPACNQNYKMDLLFYTMSLHRMDETVDNHLVCMMGDTLVFYNQKIPCKKAPLFCMKIPDRMDEKIHIEWVYSRSGALLHIQRKIWKYPHRQVGGNFEFQHRFQEKNEMCLRNAKW